ncbi:MAG TPA: ATP-dependent DNA helicase [Acidobacteriota bacterium]|nr:ATP-dependent DNA helicase [Acidobacteriota bacterium]
MSAKVPIEDVSLHEIFAPGGLLESRLPDYEYRPGQLKMAQAVLDAIRYRNHLCVEAGTGTGKTLAYLIPALFSQKRVVVSTATKNLQEQVFFKDIPFIREHLAPDLAACCMKGRANYLCLKKLGEWSRQGSLLKAGKRLRALLNEWAGRSQTGDRAELDWLGDDDPLWKALDARSETCIGSKCSHFEDCFVTRMRQKALESDLIVVNHALFFANVALQSDEIGQILPDFGTVILDEAHELEDIAADHFGRRLSSFQVQELGRDLLAVFGRRPREVKRIQRAVDKGLNLLAALPAQEGRHSLNFFHDRRLGQVDLREPLAEPFRDFYEALLMLGNRLTALPQQPDEGAALLRRIDQMMEALSTIFEERSSEFVYWFERRGRGIYIGCTPIRIASLLQQHLFQKVDSAVLTSATLAVDHSFDFIRSRLGVPDPAELQVPSEFDYPSQAMLYVPQAFPEPRSPRYAERLAEEAERILRATGGAAFLLFTSFQQMNRLHGLLADELPFPCFKQGEAPKTLLLERFKQTSGAVLFATTSFWQGVDVRGDALRAVLIDKLPFQVPSEPVVAARLNYLKEEGLDPFNSYSVPQAVITLKQGLGRLIRSRLDRGILAVFDSRLRTRRYGRTFLESLPKCPLTDNIADLENFCRRISS